MDFDVVRPRQLHDVLSLVVLELSGRDAVDDLEVLVDFGDPDVVADDHRVRVDRRVPFNVRDGVRLVVLIVTLGGVLVGCSKFTWDIVRIGSHQSFNL